MTPKQRSWLVPAGVAAAALIAAIVFHAQLIAWFGGGGGGGESAMVTQDAGKLKVGVSVEPDPPLEEGAFHFRITDAAGKPIDDAELHAQSYMPPMPGMSEMKGAVHVSAQGGGRYRGTYHVSMPGTWTLQIKVHAGGVAGWADVRFTTGSSGLTAAGAGELSEDAPGTVQIDPARQAAIGVKTTEAVVAPMKLAIRAVGRVTYDESRLSDVTLRLKGWIVHLDVSTTGQKVRRGQRLLTLYSPDLYAAQEEYLVALASQQAAAGGGGAGRVDALLAAAAKKLELYGMTSRQVADLAKRGQPEENVPILAPASGTVIEKDVVEGAAVDAGRRLFRIAALDEVWVEADVYEGDLPHVHKGQPATVTLSYLPGRTLAGKVAFVYPYLDPASRTARVRIALPNPGGDLKPDMYANVAFDVDLGPRLQVPVSAVVFTGPRRLVFVAGGGGKFVPREVTLGARNEQVVEVLSGVKAGDRVVSSGDFLVSAESRLRSSALWEDGRVQR